jgi:dihydrodipicolinate synthase/N-acetylneuraminate lyase
MVLSRRNFFFLTGSALVNAEPARKPLRGIFPIMQTPFTEGNALDLPVLAKQARFLDRCGLHGMVWPQLASEYSTLSREERMAGAETLLAASRGLRPAVVIGVQSDTAPQAVEYAHHATRLGADALIALPPQKETDKQRIFSYYKAIGEASTLPLFIQAIGDMSVEFVAGMAKEIPTLRYIKDEAGPVHSRITAFKHQAPELNAFTGYHGKTLYEEMVRGSAGTMPAAGFGDLYVPAWEHFQNGDRQQAAEYCGRALLLISSMETWGIDACKYVLHLRGIFPNWKVRRTGPGRSGEFDEQAQRAIREMLEAVKPYLRV